MIRYLLLPILSLVFIAASPHSVSDEQLFLRRIAEFWRDQEYGVVEKQIECFLATYPQSAHRDRLYTIQCEIECRTGRYLEALATSEKVHDPDLREHLSPFRLASLYKLQRYEELAAEAIGDGEEQCFYRAQSLYHLGIDAEGEIATERLRESDRLFQRVSGPYSLRAKLTRAHIADKLKEYQLAAALYLDAAAEEGSHSELCRLRAGCNQMEYDPAAALQTLEPIAKMGGEWGWAAAYNTLLLLHQTRAYEELLLRQKELQTLISAAHRPMIDYLIADSYYQLGQYEEARESARSLEHIDDASLRARRLHLIIHASLQLAQLHREQTNYQRQLAEEIQNALKEEPLFSTSELQYYRLIAGRAFYLCGEYQKGTDYLTRYLEMGEEGEITDRATAHLLLASCIAGARGECERVVAHGEQALQLAPELTGSQPLRIELFNCYLQLGEVTKAADHLYAFFCRSPEADLQIDNLLWLANQYAEEAPERAIALLSRLLTAPDGHLSIRSNGHLLDGELVTLAALLQQAGRAEEAVSLLEQAAAQLALHPEWPWSHQGEILLELGMAYEKAGSLCRAEDLYLRLTDHSATRESRWRLEGLLRLARLRCTLLPAWDEASLSPILAPLKDLQIRKRIATEPLHLEAALQCVAIQTALAPQSDRHARSLFLLKRVKEDFTSEQTIWSREYHTCRRTDPQHDAIYHAYLDLIESEIARLEGRSADASTAALRAQEAFSHLLKLKLPHSSYMRERAKGYSLSEES